MFLIGVDALKGCLGFYRLYIYYNAVKFYRKRDCEVFLVLDDHGIGCLYRLPGGQSGFCTHVESYGFFD